MNNIEEILLKLNKTQSMIEGIRLGISVSASTSQPLQNIEHILKLISADLIDITNLVSINKKVLEKENSEKEIKESNENNNSQQEVKENITDVKQEPQQPQENVQPAQNNSAEIKQEQNDTQEIVQQNDDTVNHEAQQNGNNQL